LPGLWEVIGRDEADPPKVSLDQIDKFHFGRFFGLKHDVFHYHFFAIGYLIQMPNKNLVYLSMLDWNWGMWNEISGKFQLFGMIFTLLVMLL
jgi:hypothetical protein